MARAKIEVRCLACRQVMGEGANRKRPLCSDACARRFNDYLGPAERRSFGYAQGDATVEKNDRDRVDPPTRERKS